MLLLGNQPTLDLPLKHFKRAWSRARGTEQACSATAGHAHYQSFVRGCTVHYYIGVVELVYT